MGWRQWSAVAVVIGGGILLQIPHDDTEMDHAAMGHAETLVAPSAAQGTFRTVTLDITGMT